MRSKFDWRRRDDIPAGMGDVARRRTSFLFEVMTSHHETPLSAILASAYLQGIEDAYDVIAGHPELVGEQPTIYFGA